MYEFGGYHALKCEKCGSFHFLNRTNHMKIIINGEYENAKVCDSCRQNGVIEYKNSGYYRSLSSKHYRNRIDSLLIGKSKEELKYIKSEIRMKYDNTCVLTGIKEDMNNQNTHVHIDHFIAHSTGHVGLIEGNIFPINAKLNMSKGDKNPFEWIFSQNKMDLNRWDALIESISNQYGMTIDEYKDFVYWCYSNPRDLRQIFLDGSKSSIDLWLESL